MAGNRVLKLSILADVDNLRKGLNSAEGDVSGFGGKLDGWASKAGAAFAAVGVAAAAYAGKLAIDGVKAAIEDEAAQATLAKTLSNVTGATKDQIAATEDYITKTSLAFGVTDDQLRPSLDRLVRSTKSVEEAQKLQNLALNIAAGTGKDLQAVSEALAKAHDGNFTALKKLGVPLDESIVKSKDFTAATGVLAATFKDQATTQAETFEGKMNRLKVAFAETKEGIGGFILDAVTPLVTNFTDNLLPAFTNVQDFIAKYLIPTFKDIWQFVMNFLNPIIDGLKSYWNDVTKAIVDNQDKLKPLFKLMKDLFDFASEHLAPFLGGALGLAFSTLGRFVGGVVSVFANLVSGISNALGKLKEFIDFIKDNPLTRGIGSLFSGASAPSAPSSSNSNLPASAAFGATNITINGAIDPASTARQIYDVLGLEATRTGTFGSFGVSYAI